MEDFQEQEVFVELTPEELQELKGGFSSSPSGCPRQYPPGIVSHPPGVPVHYPPGVPIIES